MHCNKFKMKRQQMIGLYAQNYHTQQELCLLLAKMSVEPYTPEHSYSALIWLSSQQPPKGIPVFTAKDLGLPLSLSEWKRFLQQSTISMIYYQNSTFSFDASQRLITNLKNKKQFLLTEKENALLIFLCQSPAHTATKEDILQSVWQYSPDAVTHTLESHLYGLKQKLGKQSEQLIQIQDGQVQLV